MAEKPGPSNLAASAAAVTVTTEDVAAVQPEGTIRVKLKKPKTDKQVQWGEGTVDNEHMNKKKSKCCCIYKKPREFGESSSSDSDDECAHCTGHKGFLT
ncbi:E3 ubiquitin-protein ligase PPP1R11 isoform X2 [Lycorma delicatula]|uniref:E3 ubiquitin-protein ligase PPP1R11 isoform X2 n=1 Tax=Lycorma delicatula TaxID=130591 RepID=UPI003F50FCE9